MEARVASVLMASRAAWRQVAPRRRPRFARRRRGEVESTGTRATVAPSTVLRAGEGETVGGSAEGRYQDGIQQPTAERLVEVPKISCQEYIKAVKDVPQERISERSARRASAAHSGADTDYEGRVRGAQNCPSGTDSGDSRGGDAGHTSERVQQLTAEQIGEVPQIREETVEIVKNTLQERISERSEAINVPKISRMGSVEVVKTSPEVRISARSQFIGVPKTSCQRSVEAVKGISQERSPKRRCELSEVTVVTETSSQYLWLRTLEQFLEETRHESLSRFPWRPPSFGCEHCFFQAMDVPALVMPSCQSGATSPSFLNTVKQTSELDSPERGRSGVPRSGNRRPS